MHTVGSLLAAARQRLGAVDAHVLVGQALGLGRAQLIARAEQPVAESDATRVLDWLARREAGEPVAYIVGRREFWGLELAVSPAVLIPRPETELLVELALHRLSGQAAPAVLDAGTGSGAVALALKSACPHARLCAIDASAAALGQAAENARRHALDVEFIESDWFGALAGRRFDLIVSNPPYIAARDPHLARGDLRFEPGMALSSGADGLDAIRILVAEAPAHLCPGAWLLFEHGYDQAGAARDMLQRAGFGLVRSWTDLAGIERVSGGCIDAVR